MNKYTVKDGLKGVWENERKILRRFQYDREKFLRVVLRIFDCEYENTYLSKFDKIIKSFEKFKFKFKKNNFSNKYNSRI